MAKKAESKKETTPKQATTAETHKDEFVEETRGAKEKPVSVSDVREKLKELIAINQKLVRQRVNEGKPFARFQVAGQRMNQMLNGQIIE